MPHTHVKGPRERLLDPELLELNLSAFLDLGFPLASLGVLFLYSRTRTGVLELDLTLHRPALPEVVSEIDHGVGNVKAAVALVVLVIVGMGIPINIVAVKVPAQGDFSVTTYHKAVSIFLGHCPEGHQKA